ncbi:hypothetical protein [Aneurinibacillus migulanus]|uniref:hypothetical protein n=1 Tax=Aneurinibacillus migulanus TaxID=47500 RepID=UPI0014773DEF|nr:hypothetical protein [Aneurinibacillus migulanus]MED0894103.1 hypothetical protein [Aneurinibacillus migulanus]MED1616834.1 hypothetical protein [Aneurinibacillus migulanus]
MHASACFLIFFLQGRDMAALLRQGRTDKISGFFGYGRQLPIDFVLGATRSTR